MKPFLNPYFALLNRLPRRGSLRTQLIAWNIAILALLLVGLGVVIRSAVYSTMIASIDHELEDRLRRFHPPPPRNSPRPPPEMELQPPGEDRRGQQPPDPRFFDQPVANKPVPNQPKPVRPEPGPPQNTDLYRPLPLDLQGSVVGRQDGRSVWDRDILAQAAKEGVASSTIVVNSIPLRTRSMRFPAQGEIGGVVQTAYPLNEVYRAMRGLDRALLMLVPVALLCAGLAGAYLTGRVLRRVRSLAVAAEQMGAQAFSQRLPVAGNDEFAGLAETFNGLLGRLEGAFKQQEKLLEQQRRFTADASHELKTPLTIIKGHTSLTLSEAAAVNSEILAPYRQSLQEIDRAADSMSHLVQDLLLLARSDGGQLGRNPITLFLREILERAISYTAVHSTLKPIMTIAEEGLCVSGNETELVRLFSNLVENAVRYTPENGSVYVTARREDAHILVTIVDTGMGIAPEHLPHLGERFYRADTSRTRPTGGTGLGLSICKGIVEAHNGSLAFTSSVGKGTTMEVRLPNGN